jgi:Putative transposase DNA-binding domain/MerR HTH family regulatory protein
MLGVVQSTLRRWELEGKLMPERTKSDQRRYSCHTLRSNCSIHKSSKMKQATVVIKLRLNPDEATKRACLDNQSRACHACTFVIFQGIEPHIRQWTCPSCLAHHNRDENAASNGLRKFLRNLSIKR